jgi:Holliday junction resolvase RusA-like endonuclease
MSNIVHITVPGTPIPLQRHRTGKGRTYLPARSKAYRELVQAAWMQAGRPCLGDAPLVMSMRFHIERPRSHFGTGRNANTLKPKAITTIPPGDIDNYCKATLDSLSTLAYTDDRQVVCLSGVHKCWADSDGPRAVVELWSATR